MDPTPNAEPIPRLDFRAGRIAATAAFCVLGLFLTAGLAIQWAGAVFGLWFSEIFIFLGVSWIILEVHGRAPWRSTAAARFKPAAALFGFAVGTLNLFALVLPIQAIAVSVAPERLSRAFDAARIFDGRGPAAMIALIGSVALAAPFCEEFCFRGVLQSEWTRWRRRPVASLVGTAFLFSALHLDPVGFAARWELGILFGLLFLKTGSLWPGVFAHAANNGVSTVILLVSRALGAREADPDWRAALGFGLTAGVPFVALLLWGSRRGWFAGPKVAGEGAPEAEAGIDAPPKPWIEAARPWVMTQTLALAVFVAVRLLLARH